jgi:Na+/glutamate symporter
MMPVWQRLLLTLAAMLLASFLIGLLWRMLFGFEMPSYLSGLVGGVAALPVWELSKRVQLKQGT